MIKSNGYIFDLENHKLIYNNEVVKLTRREYDIVYYLMCNKNIPQKAQVILDNLWGGVIVEPKTIKVHLTRIRKSLPINCIETIKTQGYFWKECHTN